MSAVEEMILFAVAVVVSVAVISVFLPQVQRVVNFGESATYRISESTSFCIKGVYTLGSETNVYIYGVSGFLPLEPRVYVDGKDVNLVSFGLLKDLDGDGILDRGDLAFVELNLAVIDGHLHRVSVWLGRANSETLVLKNGEGDNC